MKVLIIIPCYNEEKNILKVLKEIKNYNKKNKTKYDIVVINDGSTDNTEKILIENEINHISLIHNLGIGGAVQTGYKYASTNCYDIAVQFDGDGQHNVAYIKSIIKPIISGEADMVIGSRFINNGVSNFKSSKSRRVGIRIISFFIKLMSGKKIYDTTSGFRAVNQRLIKLFADDYPMEYPEPVSTTKILKNKYKVKEVAVSMNERMAGVSSLERLWKQVYYMFNVVLSIVFLSKGDANNE